MDPLSISASIVGITIATVQVSQILKAFVDGASVAPASARGVLMEVTGIHACMHQLQGFLLGHEESSKSRRSLILIEQVVIIFTDCVSTFSELEQLLESLQTGEHMRIIDRMKWSSKEAAISKILTRLQSSKSSLNFMLTILTCTSLDWAEASMRNLTNLVQEVLRSNVNMASRLKNLERMHPALASSRRPSHDDIATGETMQNRAGSRMNCSKFAFEEELETSTVYKRATLSQLRISKSSNSSNGPSYLSGKSLSDISDVSAIALPISSMELWNHHRYSSGSTGNAVAKATSLEAWYNPPAKRSAFIRTAYFNGQYTNQYAQSKFTGHLIYRRFSVAAPNSPPVFTEGAIMPRSPKELERIGEEVGEQEETFELEDTGIESQEPSPTHIPLKTALNMGTSDLNPQMGIKHALRSPPPALFQPHSRPPTRCLPLLPLTVWKNGDTLAARRRKTPSPSCSILCDEEEVIFPTRKWTKPLAEMGDALNWKMSVMNRFNAIQY